MIINVPSFHDNECFSSWQLLILHSRSALHRASPVFVFVNWLSVVQRGGSLVSRPLCPTCYASASCEVGGLTLGAPLSDAPCSPCVEQPFVPRSHPRGTVAFRDGAMQYSLYHLTRLKGVTKRYLLVVSSWERGVSSNDTPTRNLQNMNERENFPSHNGILTN